jgi:hypothetical protein
MFRQLFVANTLFKWHKNNYSIPNPQFVKEEVFKKYNLQNSIWIETGTFRGTSTIFLSKIADNVVTLEPVREFYEDVKERLKNLKNVTFINKTSEEGIEEAIKNIPDNKNVCFWLDGHFSEGNTFLGEKHSPIEYELAIIENHLNRLKDVRILVDDFRLFQNYDKENIYPSKFFLVDWAKKNNMNFEVEFDIFILIK